MHAHASYMIFNVPLEFMWFYLHECLEKPVWNYLNLDLNSILLKT